jgi:hypothetical protein
MKYLHGVVLMILTTTLITACETMTNKPRIPDNTVGSFNFTKQNGKGFGLSIFNAKGKEVKLTDKPIPKGAEKVDEVKIEFYNGSCIVNVCRRGRPCETVVIDDDSLCP